MAITYTLDKAYFYSASLGKWVEGEGSIGVDSLGKTHAICEKITIGGLNSCTGFRAYFSGTVSASFTGKVRIYVTTTEPMQALRPASYVAYGLSRDITYVSATGDVSVDTGASSISNGTYYVWIIPYWSTSGNLISSATIDSLTIDGTAGTDYYWEIRYYLKDTEKIIKTETGNDTTEYSYYDVVFTDINAPAQSSKSGTYVAGSLCTLYPVSNPTRFRCTNTSTSSSNRFICNVQVKLDSFAWASTVSAGSSFSAAITAAKWNTMNTLQTYMANAYGARITTNDVAATNPITSGYMNYCLSALRNINNKMSAGQTIPSNVAQGDVCTATLFNSVRTIMNSLISTANPSS